MPLPETIQNAPELVVGQQLYYTGFIDLTSCRAVGMGVGPIPALSIFEYCLLKEIEGDQRQDFVDIIQRLDQKYLDWSSKRGKKS